ncbi:DUF4352 domain-containing protein [Peribacillus sp. NPDC097295]|uniref:DUF4352 domain-containing protein n=1 Tax=Peribacillus sp. NPDC097295 TaxID=3364402 RepID=UPI00380581D9
MNKLLLCAFLLTTFGALNTQPAFDEESNVTEKTEESAKPLVKKEVYVPNPQIPDDRELIQVGQQVSDSKGELSLKEYKQVNETVKVGPIQVVIKDIKVMHVIPDYSMIDFFHGYTHEHAFDIVKINVKVENPTADNVKFSPVAFLETDGGEHLTWKDDIYLENLNGEVKAKNSKQGNVGFILQKEEGVKEISLLTSDVIDDEGKVISKGETVEFYF